MPVAKFHIDALAVVTRGIVAANVGRRPGFERSAGGARAPTPVLAIHIASVARIVAHATMPRDHRQFNFSEVCADDAHAFF